MHTVTLISTVHEEIGKCNADELCEIIEKINPEVIFLEALDDTYSEYQKLLFSSFGVFHKKLEIIAIQKYGINRCKYIPVLDNGLSEAFDKKYNGICESIDLQMLVDKYRILASEYGFKFLNSIESIKLQEEMRTLEDYLLSGSEINKVAKEDINTYEDSMLKNIYSYCKNNKFNIAIFMCGVAHRKSIIEKIQKQEDQERTDLNWVFYET